jgi:hypothetical protein
VGLGFPGPLLPLFSFSWQSFSLTTCAANMSLADLAKLQHETGSVPLDLYWLYDSIAAYAVQPFASYMLRDENILQTPESVEEARPAASQVLF